MWLSYSLADWYLEAVFTRTFNLWPLDVIAKVGALALVVGIVLGLAYRERRLLWFLVPVASGHGFVLMSAVYANSMLRPSRSEGVTVPFLVVELVVCAYLVYRLTGSRLAASLLSAFTLSYACFAAFIAQMSLTGDWL